MPAKNNKNKLGAIWRGEKYMSGNLDRENLAAAIESADEKIKIKIFVNDYKEEGDNRPDFNILLSTSDKKKTEPKSSLF